MNNNTLRKFVSLIFLFSLVGIRLPVFADDTKTLMMATTTSTENTGLLDVLKPAFEKASGIELKWAAMGTGKALKLGENCDVDVLMVHAPALEKAFMEKGFGLEHREFMYNDFVIIGPAEDPAGIQGKAAVEALKDISQKKQLFVSRGDNSGTHEMEIFLWTTSGCPRPEKEVWYVQSGQGMLSTILMTEEKKGYTLTDRGTYIRYESDRQGNPPLKILGEADKALFNPYSVMAVNPARCPKVNYGGALKLITWITGKEAQDLIRNFKLLGKPLFTPNAK